MKSVCIRSENDSYMFIQFKFSDAAQNCVKNLQHFIANSPVYVTVADPWLQPDFEWVINRYWEEQDSPSHILNALDDDCLREIFERLILLDLCNVVNVCTRFSRLAKDALPFKYKHCDLKKEFGFDGKFPAVNVEVALNNFGSSIQSLHVNSGHFLIHREPLSVIDQHCAQLIQLNLRNILFRQNENSEMFAMFA